MDAEKLAHALNALGEYHEKEELTAWVQGLKATANMEELRPLARTDPVRLLPALHPGASGLRAGWLALFRLSTFLFLALGWAVGYSVGSSLPPNEADFLESLKYFCAFAALAGGAVGLGVKVVRVVAAGGNDPEDATVPLGWEITVCGAWGALFGFLLAILWWLLRSAGGVAAVGALLGFVADVMVRRRLFRDRAIAVNQAAVKIAESGDKDRARLVYLRAARLADVARARDVQGVVLGNIARGYHPAYNPAGDWVAAATFYALAAQAHPDPKEKGEYLNYLGVCLCPGKHPEGDWDRAGAAFAEAARCLAGANDKATLFTSLENLAACARPTNNPAGSWEVAAALYDRSAWVAKRAGNESGLSKSLEARAFCLAKGGREPVPSANRTDSDSSAAQPRGSVWRVIGTAGASGEPVSREFIAGSQEEATAMAIFDGLEVKSVEQVS